LQDTPHPWPNASKNLPERKTDFGQQKVILFKVAGQLAAKFSITIIRKFSRVGGLMAVIFENPSVGTTSLSCIREA
jgi:hypothetical protein